MNVRSVNISEKKGTIKSPVQRAELDMTGIVGDAHAGPWHRQVSLLSEELIGAFAEEAGRTMQPGEFAENITTRGLALDEVRLLDRITIGPVELEVSQIGKTCHGDGCAIFREVGRCVMPHAGIFTRVIAPGPIQPGDSIVHAPRTVRIHTVTVSDRASAGVYEDRSGPRIREHIENHFADSHWRVKIGGEVLPDDPDQLRAALEGARDNGADVVFTTGGTGVAPRDISPDVVLEIADKTLPGIMEYIRTKYGAAKPAALLSRSVAAVAGRTLIYTLPGSRKAVDEYMSEILKTLDHLLFTLNGIDRHH